MNDDQIQSMRVSLFHPLLLWFLAVIILRFTSRVPTTESLAIFIVLRCSQLLKQVHVICYQSVIIHCHNPILLRQGSKASIASILCSIVFCFNASAGQFMLKMHTNLYILLRIFREARLKECNEIFLWNKVYFSTGLLPFLWKITRIFILPLSILVRTLVRARLECRIAIGRWSSRPLVIGWMLVI